MALIEQEPQQIRFYTDHVLIRFLDTSNSDQIKNMIRDEIKDGIDITFYFTEQYVSVIVVRDRLVCDAETIFVFIDAIKTIMINNIDA